jgi:outer membrane protein TolC
MRRIQVLLLGVFLLQLLNAQQQDLDYFLAKGLQNSPLLNDYHNRLKSARIDSMKLRATLGLQVNVTSMDSYAPVLHGRGYDEIKTDIGNVSALAGMTKEIIGNDNLRNKYQAVSLESRSTSLQGSLSEKDLKKSIISQYVLAYGDQQHQALNSDVLAVLREEEQIVKKLTENGVYKQTEYLSLLVNLRQEEIQVRQSAIKSRTDLQLLYALCGMEDTADMKLPEPLLNVITPGGPHGTLLYRQFELDSLKLANEDRRINFDYRPKLSVYADGGYLSSMNYMPWRNFGLSAGISLVVPLYNGGQRQMEHDQIILAEETRAQYRNYFNNQYRQQIKSLMGQLASQDPLIGQCREQMTYSKTLIDANRDLLRTGDISITDYLLSVSNFINARNLLIDTMLTRYNLINEINYWSQP